MKILNYKSDCRKCINKELRKLSFSATAVSLHFRMMLLRIKKIIIKIRTYLLCYI